MFRKSGQGHLFYQDPIKKDGNVVPGVGSMEISRDLYLSSVSEVVKAKPGLWGLRSESEGSKQRQ